MNTKNICFANAVLQFLVYSSSLWNLFGELGDLKRRRGAGVPEIDGGATPLVDATEKIFKEFIVEEEPLTQQQSQLGTGGASRADEENFEDRAVDLLEYMYDAMVEKRQLMPLLVRSRAHVEAFCYRFVLTLCV